MLFSIWISFHSWDGIGQMKWVGLEQYSYLLADPRFWQSIGNTLIIWVLSTVPMLLLALVIANALHNATRFRSFYRIAYFIPNVTSVVAITMVFGSIFSNNFGLLNAFLQSVGLTQIEWLTQPWGIKVAIASIVTWRWVGYNAIIFLAGLQAISTDVYEAAKVDGASPRQTFWRITVPLLRPVILFTAVTSTIGGLQIFTESQVLVGDTGGPGGSGMTIVLVPVRERVPGQPVRVRRRDRLGTVHPDRAVQHHQLAADRWLAASESAAAPPAGPRTEKEQVDAR